MKELSYAHGGNIYSAAIHYGIHRSEFLDFSANINPLGVPEVIRKSIIENIDDICHYPDPHCVELRDKIGEYLKVSKDSIIIGNGAMEVISLYLEVIDPESILIPVPSFSEYETLGVKQGSKIHFLYMDESKGFKFDIENIQKRLSQEGIKSLFLCNPNNPTSFLVDKLELIKLLDYAKVSGIHVLVDETFIELTIEGNRNSMVEFLNCYENLFIVRAFTKVFSIPGLRLGYGLGNRKYIDKMWDKKLTWSVNFFATMVGAVLNRESNYLYNTRQWILNEVDWFYNQLLKIPYIKVFRPNTNFVLLKIICENLNSYKIKDKLAKRGILIRDASNFKGLDNKFIRIAIKDRKSNLILLENLRKVMEDTEYYL